ncbi:MAG: HAD family phosphatase [Bacteroidota bacterium]
MINTIIFDLGGVLFDWNPRHLYRQIFDDPEEMEYFLTEVCSPDWNVQQDAGRPWEEAINVLLPQFPKYERHIRLYRERWPEMLAGTIDDTLALFHRIKKTDYGLFALTNWAGDTFQWTRDHHPFLNEFEGILVSGDEKMKKPDREIYELTLQRFGLVAEQCVFIDDSLKNVEGARSVGMEAIHFQGADQLEQSLLAMGLSF